MDGSPPAPQSWGDWGRAWGQEVYQLAADMGGMGFIGYNHGIILRNCDDRIIRQYNSGKLRVLNPVNFVLEIAGGEQWRAK